MSFNLNGISTCFILFNPARMYEVIAIGIAIFSILKCNFLGLVKLAETLNKPLTDEVKSKIDDDVRNAAYKIINGKNATFYGIAGALCRICQAITTNEYAILTVSSQHDEVEGVKNVCLSLPTVIGKRGIHQVIYPMLAEDEHRALADSARKIRDYSNKALEIIANNVWKCYCIFL